LSPWKSLCQVWRFWKVVSLRYGLWKFPASSMWLPRQHRDPHRSNTIRADKKASLGVIFSAFLLQTSDGSVKWNGRGNGDFTKDEFCEVAAPGPSSVLVYGYVFVVCGSDITRIHWISGQITFYIPTLCTPVYEGNCPIRDTATACTSSAVIHAVTHASPCRLLPSPQHSTYSYWLSALHVQSALLWVWVRECDVSLSAAQHQPNLGRFSSFKLWLVCRLQSIISSSDSRQLRASRVAILNFFDFLNLFYFPSSSVCGKTHGQANPKGL